MRENGFPAAAAAVAAACRRTYAPVRAVHIHCSGLAPAPTPTPRARYRRDRCERNDACTRQGGGRRSGLGRGRSVRPDHHCCRTATAVITARQRRRTCRRYRVRDGRAAGHGARATARVRRCETRHPVRAVQQRWWFYPSTTPLTRHRA